jgi:hypothetical protein
MRAARRWSWIAWAAIIACVIVALWMATPLVVRQLYPSDMATRGQFGDIFGSVNALFLGLALAGVIAAILLQREDTRTLQRAYICVEGAGIKGTKDTTTGLFTTGQLLGHAKLTNVGHLSASQVIWHLESTASNDPIGLLPSERLSVIWAAFM